MKTLLAVDFDKAACATYRANFPGVDVRCASVGDIICELPHVDVLLGGPPCQSFSVAGTRQGDEDERDCIPDFLSALEKVNPRMFLMENVPGLVSFKDGWYIGQAVKRMERAGYSVEVKELDAADYGVPQHRRRVWFWGIRQDLKTKHRWPEPTHCDPDLCGGMFETLRPWVTVGDALGLRRCVDHHEGRATAEVTNEPSVTLSNHLTSDVMPQVIGYRWSAAMLEKHPPASPASPASCVQAKWYKGGAEGLLSVDKTSDTITGGGTHKGGPEPIAHWKRQGFIRRLTVSECLRLQSAPLDFKWPAGITKTNQYKVVGNGWASLMGWRLSQAVKESMPDAKTVISLFCGGGLGDCGWHGRYS